MKISKILAGMSAAAIVASMAIMPASAATTIKGLGADSGDWQGIWAWKDRPDANTFSADSDCEVTITFTVKNKDTGWAQIVPGIIGEDGQFASICSTDKIQGIKYEKDVQFGTNEDGTKGDPTDGSQYWFQETDGNLLIKDMDCTELKFTLPASTIKEMQDNAKSDKNEGKVGGFDCNIYNVAVESVEFSQDGIKMTSETADNGDDTNSGDSSNGGTSSNDGSSKGDTSSTTSTASTAATSSKAGTTTGGTTTATSSAAASDNTAATGATAGLALAGVALAGAAIVISKRK